MKLFTKIGRDGDSPQQPDAPGRRRVSAARACRAWEEINVDRLVRRERGYLVDAGTDEVFRAYPGDAFSPSGQIVSDMTPLVFFIADGDVHVLMRDPRKWSEIVYERERRAR